MGRDLLPNIAYMGRQLALTMIQRNVTIQAIGELSDEMDRVLGCGACCNSPDVAVIASIFANKSTRRNAIVYLIQQGG